MPQIQSLCVADLTLDLRNYRVPPAVNEVGSVNALIAIKPHYFWDLTRSLLAEGYDGLENILVLEDGGDKIVREGNRRIGAMKIIHGLLPRSKFDLPDDIEDAISSLKPTWKTENERVPCVIYDKADAALVDEKVQRTHGRGETAGRLKWESVALARYERDVEKRPHPALKLLETYLEQATKISEDQRKEWGGVFPLTVLREAMQKVAIRYKLSSAADLLTEMESRPGLAKILGRIVYDVGTEELETRHVRLATWGGEYGLPPAPTSTTPTTTPPTVTPSTTTQATTPAATTPGATPPAATRGPRKTLPLSNPRSVKRELNRFAPTGKASSKVVDLLFEMKKLQIGKTPICFGLLLRSMFDVSVTAYFTKHRLPTFRVTPKGDRKEKSLGELLVEASKHLQAATTDRGIIGDLRTAQAEINAPHGLLTIPTMNGLVHSGTAIVTEAQAVAGFHKIFPLLVHLNK